MKKILPIHGQATVKGIPICSEKLQISYQTVFTHDVKESKFIRQDFLKKGKNILIT